MGTRVRSLRETKKINKSSKQFRLNTSLSLSLKSYTLSHLFVVVKIRNIALVMEWRREEKGGPR